MCAERGVAVQTIKSIARGALDRPSDVTQFTWYEPLDRSGRDRRAVRYVLGQRRAVPEHHQRRPAAAADLRGSERCR